jgi:ankyrin repeat protein
MRAVETGRVGVVRYLLDHGAGADVRDAAGRTPLNVARRSRGAEDQSGIRDIVTLLEQAAAR